MPSSYQGVDGTEKPMKGFLITKSTAIVISLVVAALLIAEGLIIGLAGRPECQVYAPIEATTKETTTKSTTSTTSATITVSTEEPDPGTWTSYRLPLNLIPTEYAVSLRPILNPNQDGEYIFYGSSTVRYVCEEPTNHIIMHSRLLDYKLSWSKSDRMSVSENGPSSDHEISMEVPEIPVSGMTSSKDTSSFSQVVFPEISDYFPPGQDVQVTYVLTDALQPSSRDWVGLFKVGWTSAREYLTFVWSPKVSSTELGDRTVAIQFSAYYLPRDNNEFYQFCYVTKQGYVRGASTPFQFRKPTECDLIEVEDETGMVMLKTRSAVLEENLEKLNEKKEALEKQIAELSEANAVLEKSFDSSKSEVAALQKEKKKREDECESLKKRIATMTEKLDKVKASLINAEEKLGKQKSQMKEATESINTLEREKSVLKDKLVAQETESKKELSLLNEQLDEKVTQLTEMEATVRDLTESVEQKKIEETAQKSELVKDRDSAKAKANRYKEEKDLYREQLAQSEEARRDVTQQLTALKEKMTGLEVEIEAKAVKINAYDEKTKMLKSELRQVEQQLVLEKGTLENQASNLEDKLNACEASKRLISDELTEARDRRDMLMSDLHKVKKEKEKIAQELESCKKKLNHVETDLQTVKDQVVRTEQRAVEKNNNLTSERMLAKEREKELKEQIRLLKSQLECADMAVAAAANYADDKGKSENGTQTAVEGKKEVSENNESVVADLKMQIEDLRTRLSMGAAAYTEKYMECHKLERKMKKIQHKPGSKIPGKKPEDSSHESTTADSQDDSAKAGKKSATKPKTPPVKQQQEEEQPTGGNFMSKLEQLFMAIADPDVEEKERANNLKSRMEELEKSVQFQHGRYKKYKQLYQEEKKSHASDQEASASEVLKLKTELDKLKVAKESLKYENEALKEQLNEFVKSSKDENVIKTREIIFPTASSGNTIIRSKYPHEDTMEQASPHSHDSTEAIKDSSSDSDLSGEFHLARTRFASGLGLCPKNQVSDESEPIAIPRPGLGGLAPSSSVIKRQPTRSPPMIEIISSGTEDVTTGQGSTPVVRPKSSSKKTARNRKSRDKRSKHHKMA